MRLAKLGGVVGALMFLAPVGQAMAAPTTPCTMTNSGSTVFNSSGQSIHIENALSTDLTMTQQLVLRSTSGPAQFFRLTSLTTGACDRNPNNPPEEGVADNTFKGTGAGNFGANASSTSPGYSISFEILDGGDGTSPETTTSDMVTFTITNTKTAAVVWTGRGNLTSGAEELGEGAVGPVGSCTPSESLTVFVKGTNVVAYVPKGAWLGGATGIGVTNVDGSSITPTNVPTPNIVNSCAADATTGEIVCTANNTDVYILNGTTLTNTLTSGSTGTAGFSGGSCNNCGVSIDPTSGLAFISMGTSGGDGFQVLNLSSDTFDPTFTSPSGEVSENPSFDVLRKYLLSASEENNFEIINMTNPTSPTFFENSISAPGIADSTAEDCSTGIAIAPYEGATPSNVFISDLTQATFTPGSPSGTWTAPSQVQTLSESDLSAGASGSAIAQGTHIGTVVGEFGGNEITAIQLPTTSGSGTPAISDWVSCAIPNTPDGVGWSEGFDPHTVTAFQDPNTGDATALYSNSTANWLANVDLTNMLNPADLPRDAAGHACASGTLPSSIVHFTSVP